MDTILVVNAGSSSVKFQVFATDGSRDLTRLIKGQMDGIGARPRLRATAADGTILMDQNYAAERVPDVPTALGLASEWLRGERKLALIAVGHRVVHGGPDYDRPVLVDRKVISNLDRYVSLAPLHQPNNLAPIRAILANSPDLPQVACFDTAFHRGHGALADHYAIPQRLYAEGVRRYGFHGLSYEFIAERLKTVAPDIANGRVIVAHLGSGASMCALAEWPQRREHDGLHGARRIADGHKARPDRSRRGALPHPGKADDRRPGPRPVLRRVRAEGPVGRQQRCARS